MVIWEMFPECGTFSSFQQMPQSQSFFLFSEPVIAEAASEQQRDELNPGFIFRLIRPIFAKFQFPPPKSEFIERKLVCGRRWRENAIFIKARTGPSAATSRMKIHKQIDVYNVKYNLSKVCVLGYIVACYNAT